MSRILLGVVVILLGASVSAEEKEKPKDPPATGEKIDGKVDRSLTGFVEKIEAKDETSGILVMGNGDDQPHYRFQIDAKTKFLTKGGEPLEGGLKSRLLLPRAEIRVVFVDVQPKGDKSAQPDTHVCRAVQIINAAK